MYIIFLSQCGLFPVLFIFWYLGRLISLMQCLPFCYYLFNALSLFSHIYPATYCIICSKFYSSFPPIVYATIDHFSFVTTYNSCTVLPPMTLSLFKLQIYIKIYSMLTLSPFSKVPQVRALSWLNDVYSIVGPLKLDSDCSVLWGSAHRKLLDTWSLAHLHKSYSTVPLVSWRCDCAILLL